MKTMLKSKMHRAHVTGANVDYDVGITAQEAALA